MNTSEIVRFRQQQQLQEEAAKRGLFGMAAVANHDSIIARMELNGEYLLSLFRQGHGQEALNLWQGGYLENHVTL